MKVRVIHPITTSRGTTPTGAIIEIPDSLFDRLKGKVEPLQFNSEHWQQIIKEMIDDFGTRDHPIGCWQWIQANRPDLWRDHVAAYQQNDQAYSDQDAGKIEQAIGKTKDTFTAMLQAWQKRNLFTQPSLVAA